MVNDNLEYEQCSDQWVKKGSLNTCKWCNLKRELKIEKTYCSKYCFQSAARSNLKRTIRIAEIKNGKVYTEDGLEFDVELFL